MNTLKRICASSWTITKNHERKSCITLIWHKSYNFRTHWMGSYKLSNSIQRVKRPIDLDRLGDRLLHQASPFPNTAFDFQQNIQ